MSTVKEWPACPARTRSLRPLDADRIYHCERELDHDGLHCAETPVGRVWWPDASSLPPEKGTLQ